MTSLLKDYIIPQNCTHLNRWCIVHRHHTITVHPRFSLYHGGPMVQLPHLMMVHTLPPAVPRGVHPAALFATVTHKYRILSQTLENTTIITTLLRLLSHLCQFMSQFKSLLSHFAQSLF